MQTIQIPWATGTGNITLTFTGQGNGTIVVESDDNNLNQERSQTLTISGGGISRQVTVVQSAKPSETPNFILRDGSYYCFRDGSLLNVKIPEPNGANEANGS